MNMDELLRSTEDRTGWQQLVRSVTNPRTEDGWSQVKSDAVLSSYVHIVSTIT